jgi:hypothetical protein
MTVRPKGKFQDRGKGRWYKEERARDNLAEKVEQRSEGVNDGSSESFKR